MHSYIKTNASLCVHIHTVFCGCWAQKEISDIIVQYFTDISKNCIKFEQSSDFKTRKLGSNFKFIDREGAFILGRSFASLSVYSCTKDLQMQSTDSSCTMLRVHDLSTTFGFQLQNQ